MVDSRFFSLRWVERGGRATLLTVVGGPDAVLTLALHLEHIAGVSRIQVRDVVTGQLVDPQRNLEPRLNAAGEMIFFPEE